MSDSKSLSQRSKLSLKKRIAFSAALASLIFVTCELISWGALHMADNSFSISNFRDRQSNLARGSTVSDAASETVHPYLQRR